MEPGISKTHNQPTTSKRSLSKRITSPTVTLASHQSTKSQECNHETTKSQINTSKRKASSDATQTSPQSSQSPECNHETTKYQINTSKRKSSSDATQTSPQSSQSQKSIQAETPSRSKYRLRSSSLSEQSSPNSVSSNLENRRKSKRLKHRSKDIDKGIHANKIPPRPQSTHRGKQTTTRVSKREQKSRKVEKSYSLRSPGRKVEKSYSLRSPGRKVEKSYSLRSPGDRVHHSYQISSDNESQESDIGSKKITEKDKNWTSKSKTAVGITKSRESKRLLLKNKDKGDDQTVDGIEGNLNQVTSPLMDKTFKGEERKTYPLRCEQQQKPSTKAVVEDNIVFDKVLTSDTGIYLK